MNIMIAIYAREGAQSRLNKVLALRLQPRQQAVRCPMG